MLTDGPVIGSLCTGYGGLDMAVQSVWGGHVAWVADNAHGPKQILAHRYPQVPNLGDITTCDWATVPPVHVLTGGTPCQDLSKAGSRQGMVAGTRSNLWVAMREAIAQLRPYAVVWENVRGALSAKAHSDMEPCAGCVGDPPAGTLMRAFGRVAGDLATLGYDCRWGTLPASAVGAPHDRPRVFLLAWQRGFRPPAPLIPPSPKLARPSHLLPTPSPQHLKQTETPDHWRRRRADVYLRTGTRHGAPLPLVIESLLEGDPLIRGNYMPRLPTPTTRDHKDLAEKAMPPAGHLGRQVWSVIDWQVFTPAIAQWEQLTRTAPSPTEDSRDGRPQLSPRFTEWLMGLPDGWVVDVPGLSRRAASIALGNGVVPQHGAEVLRRLVVADA